MSNLGEHLSSLQVFIVTDGDTENILERVFSMHWSLVFIHGMKVLDHRVYTSKNSSLHKLYKVASPIGFSHQQFLKACFPHSYQIWWNIASSRYGFSIHVPLTNYVEHLFKTLFDMF